MEEKRVRGEERMISGQNTGAGAARKNKAEQTAERNKLKEKSGSLGKVGTRLKARKSSNKNVKKC